MELNKYYCHKGFDGRPLAAKQYAFCTHANTYEEVRGSTTYLRGYHFGMDFINRRAAWRVGGSVIPRFIEVTDPAELTWVEEHLALLILKDLP